MPNLKMNSAKTLYVFDTEFHDRTYPSQPDLLSIGIVSYDKSRSYYAVVKDAEWDSIPSDHWLRQNVVPHLADPRRYDNPGYIPWRTRHEIRRDLISFFGDETPEFWGYFADWDWLLLIHLFGPMIGGPPPNFPMLCMDVEQLRRDLHLSRDVRPEQTTTEHNALNDAMWTRDYLEVLKIHEQKQLDRMGFGSV